MGEKFGICRCEGGPGGPLMLRSPKLQKRASDPEGPKMAFPKIAPHQFFWIWGHLPMDPKWGVQNHPPCVPLRGQLPIVKAYLGVEQN